jgi:hypothetical protein
MSESMEIPTNLNEICYKMIEENKELYGDLKQYDIDHSEQFEITEKFLSNQTCCNRYYNFLKEIFKNTKYISCDEIIDILDKNVDELISYISSGYIPILITTVDSITKSNIFFSLYLLIKLESKGYKIDKIYDSFKTILVNKDNERSIELFKPEISIRETDKVLIILCDDVSYSGRQIYEHIATEYNEFFDPIYKKRNFNQNVKIFLNVVGLLPKALKQINKAFYNSPSTNLIIPKNTFLPSETEKYTNIKILIESLLEGSETIDNFLKLNDCYTLIRNEDIISLKSKMTVDGMFDYRSSLGSVSLEQSLVYLFMKYPDAQSTYGKLCSIEFLENVLTLNVDKFITTFSLTNKLFCDHINDNMTILDLLKKLEVPEAEAIVKNIIDNYEKILAGDIKIEWLDVAINDSSFNEKIFKNDKGKWLKTINNFSSDEQYIKDFNGKCFMSKQKSVIKPFYDNLRPTINSTTIRPVSTLMDIYLQNKTYERENSLLKKYLKYKGKYLKIKNKK